ncbi:DUF1827 family protein [Lactobacillus jensenii]|jgi:hypothetical protein|nr:DUF1827 family protein [Lactobacillus jensenii]MCT7681394.1 DUF1827 family protein [Lactobacillus crispatus]APT14430.1 hypothetical protein BUE77_03020 [Lactobacillus jensenii]EEQ25016.1 hypothetical protein LACJE0001_0887 [Lactobacillus jensenii 269-3]KRM50658.1 hypothetical protein FC45_GL001333 [Lactobacillus jensenii DSM 20557]MBS5832155.1 DUF1827 family protein [Lactobacillus jensenii]
MHLIDVTNTYSDLVQNQLNSTSAQYIKVYSLGNSSVVYTETDSDIEIVIENHDRKIKDEEVEFLIRRLIHDDRSYDITIDKTKKIIAITCKK